MHARHQNGPGNGYRSNMMGMGGVAPASRIPPEGSMRGYRMYNSEYRNYNRGGYGSGGHAKQYQPPLPPPREADVFMEAGKMAAEYLVSKGMLPPNALSGKWQSDGLKNQVGNFQGVRSNEAEKLQSSVDSRASAHSRLGNASLDVGQGRRKYSDEYGSRNSIKGRKRTGSFKNYGSEVSRELGRSGSLIEKSKTFHSTEVESDASVGHHGEQPAGKDGNIEMHNSSPGETAQQTESETQVVSGLEKRNLVEDAGGDSSTLSNEKCLTSNANGEPMKKDEAELVKEQNSDNNLQQKNDEKKEAASSGMEDILVSKDYVDLVKQCKFVNVPTKARSSLTIKSSKGDQYPSKEDENICKKEPSEHSGVHIIDVDIENLAGNAATHHNHEFKSLHSDDPTSVKEKERNIKYSTRSALSLRSESFPERSQYREHQQDEGLSAFGRSKSMLMERGEKRAIDHNPDDKDDFKKHRQWVSPQDTQSNSSPPIACSMENKPLPQEPSTSQSAHLAQSPDHKSLDISLLPKDHADSCEFMQEKQLFPSSFKTCDLNLVGACDGNENRDADPMLGFPSITQTGKAATPIDVDLSMGNNCNLPNKISKHSANEKDIEVIDLEKDSAHEDKTFDNPDRRGDTVFTDLDGFPNNVSNATGMPDAQDGYGLMMELLGNDSPNCSSVPTDLNSLHNHIGLPNAEGILGDDDSIYMSLGEIPISILGAWEQPSQDYGKPF